MPAIVIVGNSGAARECYWIVRDLQEAYPGMARYYDFAGFLSWREYPDNLKELQGYSLGDLDKHEIRHDYLYVIGVGKPRIRADIFAALKSRGATLMNLIHPWTSICPSAELGEGNIFQRGSTVYANAVVGNGNYINGAVNFSHDTRIGDFNFFGPYAMILGSASIGSYNQFGPHCTVLDKARVGDSNLLAPGAVIMKGAGSNAVLAGNPALKVGEHKE